MPHLASLDIDHPDSELIAACARLIANNREECEIIGRAETCEPEAEAARDAALKPLSDERHRLVSRITALKATQLEEHQARARAQLEVYDLPERITPCQDDQLLWALVRDLAHTSDCYGAH